MLARPRTAPNATRVLAAALATTLAMTLTAPSAAASTPTIPVKVFNYPGLNGGVGSTSCGNENYNLISIIDALPGYSVDGDLQSFGGTAWRDGTKPAQYTVDFFAEQLAEAVFFVMTDMETEDPGTQEFYPDAARTVLRNWVEQDGGILVMTGTYGDRDSEMLNLTFGWDLTTNQSGSSWAENTANTAGTPFAAVDAATLPDTDATDAIGGGTVAGFTPMWGTDTDATVAVIPAGQGTVIFLGFDFFDAGPGCGQNNDVWVQEVLPAALNFARDLSLERIPEELRRELGLPVTNRGSDEPELQTLAIAAEQAPGLSGTGGLLVRRDTPVPLTSTISRSAGPRGGLVLEDEEGSLKVTVTTAGGVSPTTGLVVPPGGEIVCEICALLAAGTVVEAWVFSEPRLAAAIRVDVEDGVCPLLRIPTGTPLDGGGAIEPGVHTLQLRMYTTTGFEVLAVPIRIGGVTPSRVPAGDGGAAPWHDALWQGLALLTLSAGLVAATAARREREQRATGRH